LASNPYCSLLVKPLSSVSRTALPYIFAMHFYVFRQADYYRIN
jgi:hypothetical protein